jgi:hypothetical protein
MDFSRLDGEVDVAIGHYAGETLDDVSHGESRQLRLLTRCRAQSCGWPPHE